MKRAGRLLAALALAACVPQDPAPGTRLSADAASQRAHEQGRRIYNFRCYFCHGYSGDARTLAATYLSPPPRDFTGATEATLTREAMVAAIFDGKQGTAMKSFASVLAREEIAAVADFVRAEFMLARAPNTRYHTPANGWPDHERNRSAFPFARGEVAIDRPDAELTGAERDGKRLFLAACISCHDRGRVNAEGPIWETRPLSFPRNGFDPAQAAAALPVIDGYSGASPYARHDLAPAVADLTPAERVGEKLFQGNCAFCHAADGTGKNWIGSFLEPHPRNLTSDDEMRGITRARLTQVIADGLPGTSMPAWKTVLRPEEIRAVAAYVARAFHPLPE
jgi:cytochrome c oxidase cbb3-type subunit 3